jgi:hypothetical protein
VADASISIGIAVLILFQNIFFKEPKKKQAVIESGVDHSVDQP